MAVWGLMCFQPQVYIVQAFILTGSDLGAQHPVVYAVVLLAHLGISFLAAAENKMDIGSKRG